MAFKTTVAACILAVLTAGSVGAAPAFAGQSRTIVLTPKGKQAEAVREGLRVYGWANNARNTATVDQRGTRNAAGISQHGTGNFGLVAQRGQNNSANLAQNGNNNALAVFQVGRGHQAIATQTGNNKTAIIVQAGR